MAPLIKREHLNERENEMTKQAPKTAVEEIIDVAIDDGHAGIKLFMREGGQEKYLRINSRVRMGIHGTTMIDHPGAGAKMVVPSYETDGGQYTAGDFHDAETARFDDYPFSGINRVLVAHVLRLAGLGGKKVRLATGLPLSRFYKPGGHPNEDVIKRKTEAIMKPVSAADGSPVAEIVEHVVFPEGLGAYIDYAAGDDGQMRAGSNVQTVAVVDIGGRTTDTAVVLPGRMIDHSRTGSADIGVLNLIEDVGSRLARELKTEIPGFRVEEAINNGGTLPVWGKPTNISDKIQAASDAVMARIMVEVNRRLGSGVDIDQILLVGGGAHIFQRSLSNYPNMTVVERPEFANARGFYKYLVL